jgi:hypothetical protein
MLKFLFMFLAACVAFLMLWVMIGKNNTSKEKKDIYTCPVCGERDCLCEKE